VDQDGANWSIKDYAFNETPDQAITAGQQTLGVGSQSLEQVRVVALNKSIGLYQLPNHTNYTLYNMTGQKVLTGVASDNVHVIEANAMASGIYLIELEDQETKARLKKKIVL
jgi:hypothetical protein